MRVADLREAIEGLPDDADVYVMQDDSHVETLAVAAQVEGDLVLYVSLIDMPADATVLWKTDEEDE